jgi:predicted ATP-grasp superfamily ATP-dependent carboligase
MRILVHEFASGGGFAGRRVPPSLAREGRAMLNALLADLSALGCHDIVTTTDSRFALTATAGLDVVTIHSRAGPRRAETGAGALQASESVLDPVLLARVDAVWLIAPETGRCLERLTAAVERADTMVLGTEAAAIRVAADKQCLPRRLRRCRVPHPRTRVVRPGVPLSRLARDLGYPIVVKPRRGAGCEGVRIARNERELRAAIGSRRAAAAPRAGILLQEYVRGVDASVSLISDGCRAVALAINAQTIRSGRTLSYLGGRTPLDHPLASRAIDAAVRACEALPGLRGYVGVDLVLTDSNAVVIEVNPRLTTAYLGVRAAIGSRNGNGNVAALAIQACHGALPAPPPVRRSVRFTSAGRIVVAS